MKVTDNIEENEIDAEQESVYEQFVQFVMENEEKFEEHVWGRFDGNMTMVCVRPSIMNDFLDRVGISNKIKTLSFWKSKGILNVSGDGKHLSRSVRIGGLIKRAYVMTWPNPGENDDKVKTSETATGFKVGDKAELVDLESGEVIKIQLLVNVDVVDVGNSKISVESPLGKARIIKSSGPDKKKSSSYRCMNQE
ncbi:MAG: hypothetical protein ACYCX4_18260 [Bacillota bacterium]